MAPSSWWRAMLLSQNTNLPFWGGLIGLLFVFIRMFMAWKKEEQARKETNQPHTLKDDALLLLSALLLVGLMITPWFFEPLRAILLAPIGGVLFVLIFIPLAFGLTYVFNRRKRTRPKRPRSSYGN